MSWLNDIAQAKFKGAAVVFAVALAIRLAYCFTSFDTYFNNDAVGFHNLAVNVALGNGYSTFTQPPYEPHFLREPGYPLFLAGVYSAYSLFGTPHYLTANTISLADYPEIQWARIAQAILGAFTCVLFLKLLRLRFRSTQSFVLALLFSAYLPLAGFSAMLLRETLQAFLVMALAYSLARFLLARQPKWLAMFTVVWALSNLTLQTTLLLFVPAFVFMWIIFRNLSLAVRYTTIASLGMALLVSPWLIRTYLYYPDLRTVKTFGTSLTFEGMNFIHSQLELARQGTISTDSAYKLIHSEFYDLSDREKFERSYGGAYTGLMAKYGAPKSSIWEQGVKRSLLYFRRSWIEGLWIAVLPNSSFDLHPHGVYKAEKKWGLYALSLIAPIFGYLALIGMMLFYRRLLVLMPLFSYFLVLIPLIGDETRRFLPVHAFIFLFSCLLFYYAYMRLVARKGHRESLNEIVPTESNEPIAKPRPAITAQLASEV